MEESLFIEWVKKYFPSITISIVETLNGENRQPSYLFKRFLKPSYSVSGKWESLSVNGTLVAADIVSMDSSLPLKKRASIGKASGDIPKMGMELKLNEKQLTDLDTLVAMGGTDAQILQKLFEDTGKVVGGVYERNEAIFLEGLSTGIGLVEDTENVGSGIRVDYGFLPANKFESEVPWSDPTSTPFTDIQPLLDKSSADGYPITLVMLDRATWNAISKSQEAKDIYASGLQIIGNNVPVPTFSQLNTAVKDRYGFVFEIVDRTIRYEKNGIQTSVKPWAAGQVVFLNSENVGELVFARLAEQNHPVAGVQYSVADGYILVSKYRMNKPSLSEYTSSQARVVPVIHNVQSIYLFDSTVTAG